MKSCKNAISRAGNHEHIGNGLRALPNLPGIYCVMNRVTRRCYIGKAEKIRTRCNGHWNALRTRMDLNSDFRKEVEDYGVDAFFFFTLRVFNSVAEADQAGGLSNIEDDFILLFDAHTEKGGYNRMVGGRWTPEARARNSEQKRRRNQPMGDLDEGPEHR